MVGSSRLKELAPYVVVLGAAVYFYYLADHFDYTAMPDRMGPDGWPKLILILLGLVCLYEIARRLIVAARGAPAAAAEDQAPALGQDEDMEAASGESHPGLVGGAVVATICYLLLWDTVGFFLGTFVYTAVLMWLGGFRRVAVLLPLAAAISLFFMFMFMRIIFVALPLGVEPFSRVSIGLMTLMGIH